MADRDDTSLVAAKKSISHYYFSPFEDFIHLDDAIDAIDDHYRRRMIAPMQKVLNREAYDISKKITVLTL